MPDDSSNSGTTPATTPHTQIEGETIIFSSTELPVEGEDRKNFIREKIYLHLDSIDDSNITEAEAKKYIETLYIEADDPVLSKELNTIKDEIVNDELHLLYGRILFKDFFNTSVLDTTLPKIDWNSYIGNATGDSSHQNIEPGADPVHLFNGNFVYSATDLQIDGAGINFTFTRIYAQLAKYYGPLGFKWDHAYNLWIRVSGDNMTIDVSTGTLRLDLYRRHALYNYWIPPDGATNVLLENADSFLLRNPDGSKVIYQPHPTQGPFVHIVHRIEDRFGNYLQFFYTEGSLSRIEINHPGRFVRFQYDTLDRIAAIVDFTGRIWKYYYDDGGDLAAVTTPATLEYKKGTTTRYEYSTSSLTDPQAQHNLTAIIDADGQIYLENEYGTDKGLLSYNRIICQRQGSGDTLFDYADVIENFNVSYHSNERPAFQTIVTERDGRQIKFLFNHYGNMIFKEEYARINGIPKLISNHYRYNKDGNLIGTMSPSGIITQYLYGRDYFEKRFPQDNDYRYETDEHLLQNVRQGFNTLVAIVKRKGYYNINSLNLSRGLWATDIFPDIYETNDEDIIQKFSYENEFFQLLTSSDTRFTKSSSLDFLEPENYELHLTKYHYKPANGFQHFYLSSIEYPAPALPDGTVSSAVITSFDQYDTKGKLIKKIASNGLQTLYNYYLEEDGLLEGFNKSIELISGELSIKIGYDRDTLGRPIKNYRPKYYEFVDGRFFSSTEYNAMSQVVKSISTLPFQITTENYYNRTGNIAKTRLTLKDSSNNQTGFFETDFKYNEEFHQTLSSSGNILSRDVKQSKMIYDRAGRPYISIEPSGYKHKLLYNERGIQWQKIDDYGSVHAKTRSYFDVDGRIIRTVDALGRISRMNYDALGRPVEMEDAKGNKLIKHYDKAGNIVVELFFEKLSEDEYKLLSRKEFKYDTLGRNIVTAGNLFGESVLVSSDTLLATYIEEGPGILLVNQLFYDKMGNVYKTVDPSGKICISEYDVLGRVVKKIDPLGNETSYQHDSENNITRTDRKNAVRDEVTGEITGYLYFAETAVYDELNRLVEKTDSLGNITKYSYDSRNNLVKIIDPLNNIVEKRYDLFNRLIENIQYLHTYVPDEVPEPIITNWAYNHFNKVTTQVDALGRLTRFIYDSSGRQTSSILPDGSTDEIVYDRANKIVSYKDRNGLLQAFRYDELNRNTALQVDASWLADEEDFFGALNFIIAYDGLGRRIRLENDQCITSFKYNSLGWNTEEENALKPLDGLAFTEPFVIKRQFNSSGSLIDLTYPAQRKIEYQRDELERIISIRQIQKGNEYPGDVSMPDNYLITAMHYEGLLRKQISRGNNTNTEYKYDFGTRLSEIKHSSNNSPFLQLQFLYDGLGNMKQRTEIANEFQKTQLYHYDSISRLVNGKNKDSASLSDISVVRPSQVPVPKIIPDYQAQVNALLSVDGLAEISNYNYDKVGNRETALIKGMEQEYEPNNLDQYKKVNTLTCVFNKNGNLRNEETFEYSYNHRNQLSRIKKADGSEIVLLYDALGRRCIQKAGTQVSVMIYDGYNLLEEYRNGTLKCSMVNGEGQDNLLQCSKDGNELYFYPDLTKSVRYLFKGTDMYNYYQYDDFGNISNMLNTDDGNLFRFGGKRILTEINKYDFIFRTYDPATGRFIQRDPKGFVDGTNLYSYVRNNPLIKTDPFGEESRTEIKSHTQTPIKKPLQKSVNNASNNNNDWSLLDNPIWNTVTNDALGLVFSLPNNARLWGGNFDTFRKNLHWSSLTSSLNYDSKFQKILNNLSKHFGKTGLKFLDSLEDALIKFGKGSFAANIDRILTPLGLISNSISLYDTWANPGNKSLPEKLGDTAGAGAGLFSSFVGTANIAGKLPSLGPAGAVAGAFAGGYAAGQLLVEHTDWNEDLAMRGLKVEQLMKDTYRNIGFENPLTNAASSFLGGIATIPFLSETTFGVADPYLNAKYSDDIFIEK